MANLLSSVLDADWSSLTKIRQQHMLNEKQELDFNVYLFIANLQLIIFLDYMDYIDYIHRICCKLGELVL